MTAALESRLPELSFDNRFTRELPADPVTGSTRRQIRGALYSRVQPTPVAKPQLVAHAREVAEFLGLDEQDCLTPTFAEVFSGNHVLPGMDPHATCYGGHQFGNWAGQLGDGRAINLGEIVNAAGERWMLQLKGAGPTPYSRTADGLAVLRSSLREFLCSEAMFHLGVPTTRALCLTLTGEQVVRDMLYDGHPAPEPGAVVCRVAPSFTRFGHFEMLAARQETDLLKAFADFTIENDFPDIFAAHRRGVSIPEGQAAQGAADPKTLYVDWFERVCTLTAEMIVEWMRVGFVHGVMNTDNMSILGLTIDYGPYGWLEDYDPNWTPNTTDAGGKRYRFSHQPAIAQWNLVRLANAVYPLVGEAAPLETAIGQFEQTYNRLWQATLRNKLGLVGERSTDQALFDELDAVLQLAETDMTIFFRKLADVSGGAPKPSVDELLPAYYLPAQLTPDVRARVDNWLVDYAARVGSDDEGRRARMNAVNPKYVLRNYLAQLAIDEVEQGNLAAVSELLEVLRHPYDDQPGNERYAEKRPEWARSRVGCSMLSCSS